MTDDIGDRLGDWYIKVLISKTGVAGISGSGAGDDTLLAAAGGGNGFPRCRKSC